MVSDSYQAWQVITILPQHVFIEIRHFQKFTDFKTIYTISVTRSAFEYWQDLHSPLAVTSNVISGLAVKQG